MKKITSNKRMYSVTYRFESMGNGVEMTKRQLRELLRKNGFDTENLDLDEGDEVVNESVSNDHLTAFDDSISWVPLDEN